jgi:effector-binding domain-containing protein
MSIDVEIREIDPQPFMAMHFKCAPEELGPKFGVVLPATFGYVMSQGKQPAGMPVAHYLSVSSELFEVEAGVPVAQPMDESDTVKNRTLPGGRVAVTRHVGPYENLRHTYEAFEKWIAENGHQPRGGAWEVYVTDPSSEPDSSKWVTEIYWPIG